MNKLVYMIAALVLTACTGSNNTYQQEAEKLSELLESYMDNYDDSSDIKAVNNEEKGCIELEWKGKLMTICYNIYFKDLLSDNPTSYAKDFLISMVLFDSGIKGVTDMELKINDITFKVTPSTVEHFNEFSVVGFFGSSESFNETMKILSYPHGIVEAWLNTNKGKIEIPLYDVTNLEAMSMSYRLDGGTFE